MPGAKIDCPRHCCVRKQTVRARLNLRREIDCVSGFILQREIDRRAGYILHQEIDRRSGLILHQENHGLNKRMFLKQ